MLFRSDALSIARNTLVFTINRYYGASGSHKFTSLRDLSTYRYTSRLRENLNLCGCPRLFKSGPECYFRGADTRGGSLLFFFFACRGIGSRFYFHHNINDSFSTVAAASEQKSVAIPRRHSEISSTRFRLSLSLGENVLRRSKVNLILIQAP